MSPAALKHANIQYRRQDLSKGHGIARPSKTDPTGAIGKAVNKVLEERKEILVEVSTV